MRKILTLFGCLGILVIAACAPTATETVEPSGQATAIPSPTAAPVSTESPSESMEPAQPFELRSAAFNQGQPIPQNYSCDGDDISPPLAWSGTPEGAQSLALIMDDPDAPGGTWDHWIVFNLPAGGRELPEAVSAADIDATFGVNSWGRSDYGGPCPPSGTHRYFFKLYALDTRLDLDENAGKSQVLSAMEGHILAETELMGTYNR